MDKMLEKIESGISWFMKWIICPVVVVFLIVLCIAFWMIALGNS